MSEARTLGKNFLIQFLGKVGSIAIGIVLIAVMARALGPHGYGEYTTAITLLQFFGVFVDFGLTLALVVMISEPGAQEEQVVGSIFGLRSVSSIVVFALAPVIALAFPWSAEVKWTIAFGAIAYALMAIAALMTGVYQKHAVIWRAAVAELVSRVILLVLTVLVATTGAGASWYAAILVAANVVWLILAVQLAKPFVRVRLLVDLQQWKVVMHRSWPIAISTMFNLLYLKGDVLILSVLRSQTEVGVYGAAYRLLDVLTAIPTIYMGLLLPSLVSDWAHTRTEEFRAHLRRTFDVFMLAAVPMVFGAFAVGRSLMEFIAGPGYDVAGSVLSVLILAVPGIFLSTLYGHAVVALNQQRRMTFGYALTAVFGLIGYFVFIPMYGLWGAAWMTVACEALIAVFTFWMVTRVSGALPSPVRLTKAVVAGVAMMLVLNALPDWHPLVEIAIGAMMHVIGLAVLRTIPLNELRALLPDRRATV